MPRTAGLHPHFEGSKKVTGADMTHRDTTSVEPDAGTLAG